MVKAIELRVGDLLRRKDDGQLFYVLAVGEWISVAHVRDVLVTYNDAVKTEDIRATAYTGDNLEIIARDDEAVGYLAAFGVARRVEG